MKRKTVKLGTSDKYVYFKFHSYTQVFFQNKCGTFIPLGEKMQYFLWTFITWPEHKCVSKYKLSI